MRSIIPTLFSQHTLISVRKSIGAFGKSATHRARCFLFEGPAVDTADSGAGGKSLMLLHFLPMRCSANCDIEESGVAED